jgi:hypothetical protein
MQNKLRDGVPEGYVPFSAWVPRIVSRGGATIKVDDDLAIVEKAAKNCNMPYRVVTRETQIGGERVEQRCVVVEEKAYEAWRKRMTTI